MNLISLAQIFHAIKTNITLFQLITFLFSDFLAIWFFCHHLAMLSQGYLQATANISVLGDTFPGVFKGNLVLQKRTATHADTWANVFIKWEWRRKVCISVEGLCPGESLDYQAKAHTLSFVAVRFKLALL